jgi:hypothetical protein
VCDGLGSKDIEFVQLTKTPGIGSLQQGLLM